MEQDVGLGLIHEADPSHCTTVDIVAVSGLHGHAYRTWTASSGAFWLRDFVPQNIPRARILTFGYDSSVASFTTQSSLSSHANDLLRSLAAQRKQDQERNRPLIWIAHSLGGLIVKQALMLAFNKNNRINREIFDATAGVIFFGTPHSGRNSKNIARVLQYYLSSGTRESGLKYQHSRPSIVSELVYMQRTFEEFLSQKLYGFRLISFFEELPIPGFGLVVDEQPEPNFTSLPIHADHNKICKFTDISEPSYQRVLGELKKICKFTNISELNYQLVLGKSKKLAPIRTETRTSLNLESQVDYLLYPRIDNGSDRVVSAFVGTCEWIPNHTLFKSWIADNQNSIFWISGIPGSGKSVVLKYISELLIDGILASPGTISASFFFELSFNIDRTHTLIQSLLFQIFSQVPTEMGHFMPTQSNQYSCSAAPSRQWKQSLIWKSKSLLGLLEESLLRISRSQKVYLIIDALDECSEAEFADVLSILSFLDSNELENPVKVCLSSRPDWNLHILDRLCHQKVTLEAENSADIRRYVESRISRLVRDPVKDLEKKSHEAILNELSEKARGVFLWVSLAFDNVLRVDYTIEALQQAILKVPGNLDEIYSSMINRIIQDDHHTNGLAKKILAWIFFARRPLSVNEIQHALSVDEFHSFSDDKSKNSFPFATIDKEWLLSNYLGLVRVGERGQQIYLVHSSVKEYLSKSTLWNTPNGKEGSGLPYPQNIHSYLAEVCLRYIRLSLHIKKSRAQLKPLQDESDGFLDYARDFWPKHTKLADLPGSPHTTILESLGWPFTKVLNQWAHLHQKRIGDRNVSDYWGWTPLHASAAFGLQSLALAIRETVGLNLARWDIGDVNGRTPLSWAAWEGNINIVEFLIDTGASVNTREIRHGFSPLHMAVLKGNTAVVELLLAKGAEINISDSSSTPLSVAAAMGHEHIVKLLLQTGASIDMVGKKGGLTPLHLSAGYGHEAVVAVLLDFGANPNIVNSSTKQTPLYYATAGGHQGVIRILLSHGGGIPQPMIGAITNIPVSWAHRVACSLIEGFNDSSTSRECTSSKTDSASSSYSVPTKLQSGTISQEASKKRPREILGSGEGSGDDESGNNPNKRPILNPAPPSPLKGANWRLACPYFKFDPERYNSPKLCAGPRGWASINRLKEHLYKHHFAHICQRCNLFFGNRQDLDAHYKAVVPCSAKLDRDYGDGFDDNQRSQLKSRTGKREIGGTELEYWKSVYQILFPNVPVTLVPTPFYEEQNLAKKSYDEQCALVRNKDSDLQKRIFQVIHDPQEVNQVATILALINDHQAVSVNPPIARDNTPNKAPSRSLPITINSSGPDYQPFPFEFLNSDLSSISPMPTPWGFQQHESEFDSGFYSGSSASTERERLLLGSQSVEISYPPTIPNPIEDERIRPTSSVPTTDEGDKEANVAESFDVEVLTGWDINSADFPHPSL